MPIPVGVTLNAQQISHPIIEFYYYAIPDISKLDPSQGPISGGTTIKVIGLNMYPLSDIKNVDVSKTTYFKFGDYHVKGKLVEKKYALTVSPKSNTLGKVLVQVRILKNIHFFIFLFIIF